MHEPLEENDVTFELTIHEEGEELPTVDSRVSGFLTGFVKVYKPEDLPEHLKDTDGLVTSLEIVCDNMAVDEVAGVLLFIMHHYPEAVDLVEKMTEMGEGGKGPIITFRDAEDEDL